MLAFLFGCEVEKQPNKLPILGNKEVVDGDTVYHTIPDL